MNARTCLLAAVCCLLCVSCKKFEATDPPADLAYVRAYDASSPFNTPIPANPGIDANSAAMVQSLVDEATGQGFVLAVKSWTMPVYFAGAETPVYDVKLTAGWAPKKKLLNVPVPDFAQPDPEDDGHMVIIDTASGYAYDFWQAKRTNKGWSASWGNAMPWTGGDGVYDQGLSCRGSGFGLLGGLVWPRELAHGDIPHALVFSFDHTRSGGPVWPATESDGTTDGNSAIPEGARVQLDPTLDLDSMGLTGYAKTIARCLQVYGMYCGDDGGGLQLYAVNSQSVSVNPYAGILPDDEWVSLPPEIVPHMRVLTLGPQDPEPAWGAVENACADFE